MSGGNSLILSTYEGSKSSHDPSAVEFFVMPLALASVDGLFNGLTTEFRYWNLLCASCEEKL